MTARIAVALVMVVVASDLWVFFFPTYVVARRK